MVWFKQTMQLTLLLLLELRSLHTENFVWNFSHVKQMNTTSHRVNDFPCCHFVSHKSIRMKFDFFCIFRIRGKHFERYFDSSDPTPKWTPKSRMAIVKQKKNTAHSLHTEFTEMVLFLICGSRIASKASNWATDFLKQTLNRPW